MKGTSLNVEQAKELMKTLRPELDALGMGGIIELNEYKKDWKGKQMELLGHDIIALKKYTVARRNGCNEIEARLYAITN